MCVCQLFNVSFVSCMCFERNFLGRLALVQHQRGVLDERLNRKEIFIPHKYLLEEDFRVHISSISSIDRGNEEPSEHRKMKELKELRPC